MSKKVFVPIKNANGYVKVLGIRPYCNDIIYKRFRDGVTRLKTFDLFIDVNSGYLYPSAFCGALPAPVFAKHMLDFVGLGLKTFELIKINICNVEVGGQIKRDSDWFFPAPKRTAIYTDEKEFLVSNNICGCIKGVFLCKEEFREKVFFLNDVRFEKYSSKKIFKPMALPNASNILNKLKFKEVEIEAFILKICAMLKHKFRILNKLSNNGMAVGICVDRKSGVINLLISTKFEKNGMHIVDFEHCIEIIDWARDCAGYKLPAKADFAAISSAIGYEINNFFMRTKPHFLFKIGLAYDGEETFEIVYEKSAL